MQKLKINFWKFLPNEDLGEGRGNGKNLPGNGFAEILIYIQFPFLADSTEMFEFYSLWFNVV